MMSKSPNMLRTRRRDINIKPNRRLDRKSSRGMIYENEELRLRTININAEIERGQYDIKKLKRENEMLKKEIWCLRDEYEKLDKLLKEKEIEFSSSSTTCTSDGSCTSDTESGSSCSSDDECELEEDEQSQNLENVQKTTNMQQQQQQQNYQHHHHHYQHHEFDHLSVVVEENENSDKNSHTTTISPPPPPPLLSPTTTTTNNNNNNNNDNTIIKPDQSYPIYEKSNTLPITSIPTHQNSIINRKFSKSHDTIYPNQLYHDINDNNDNNIDNNWMNCNQIVTENNEIINKTTTDLIVKTDNRNFNNNFNDNNIDNNGNNNNNNNTTPSRSTFSNGGNLEELLNDIETISKDILQITNQQKNIDNNDNNFDNNIDNNEQQQQQQQKPYKSELNVVLMPNPMPLIGFEKYEDLKKSLENLQETEIIENPFDFSDYFQQRYNPENFENFPQQQQQQDKGSKTNLLELSTSDHCLSSENDENCKIKTTNDKKQQQEQQQPKLSIRRKVSIHFKGKKDKQLKTPTPTLEKKPSIFSLLTPSIDNKQQQQQQQIKTPSIESRKSTTDNEPKTPTSSDSRLGSDFKKQLKQRKSISISPERSIVTTNQTKQQQQQQQQQHHDKKHKRHKKIDKNRQLNKRRDTISSIDNFNNIKLNRERSYSVCTDRSNIFPNNNNNNNNNNYRERTNSLSSCDTIQNRKMSAISNLQINGKVPWCACWGNGCI